jgi:hypothetical protein
MWEFQSDALPGVQFFGPRLLIAILVDNSCRALVGRRSDVIARPPDAVAEVAETPVRAMSGHRRWPAVVN